VVNSLCIGIFIVVVGAVAAFELVSDN